MIAPELRPRIVEIVARCDELARAAIELRRDVIDDDDGLGWVLRLQDRMAQVRVEAAGLLDDRAGFGLHYGPGPPGEPAGRLDDEPDPAHAASLDPWRYGR